jgi:hypothetical protein
MLAIDMFDNYWIFDWKTAGAISKKWEFLQLDDQVGSYVWALVKIGMPIKGFVYHEQKKAFPAPPKRNKYRRLGRAFSISFSQDTEYRIYLQTVQEEDKEAYEAGLYDEFLEHLQSENATQYFARMQIAKTIEELEEIERNIGLEILDMLDPSLRIYPSPGRFACGYCAFQTPCIEKNSQGDFQFALDTMFERREHYYVRELPSTESKGAE